MKTQYQLVIQYIEGFYTPITPPIPQLEEAVAYRSTYAQKDNIFIARIINQVMSEEEIEQEINERN